MKVADVMSRQVDFVTTKTSVRDVARLIFGRGVNGVPVCEGKKVVGFVTERDILEKFYPSMQEFVEDPVHSGDFEAMEQKAVEVFSLNVEKVMSKHPTTVTAETPILRAQSLMFVHKVGRLPVVDSKGNLVGIISKGDIFRSAVGDKLELAEDEEYNDWLSKRYYLTVDWKNRLSLEIPDLVALFKKNNVKKVIDIGCGGGEHVIALANEGFSAVGVERSPLMIQNAEAEKNKLPKDSKERISFFAGEYDDMIDTFKNDGFDAALIVGNTLPHNPRNWKNVIKNTAKVLGSSGVLVLQITNFEKVLKANNRLLSFTPVKSDYTASPFREHVFLEFYDPSRDAGKTLLKTFSIFDFDGRRWNFYGLRNALFAYITKEEITKELKENGYKDISFYGSSFDGKEWDHLFRKPFKPLESDWLNVVARR